MKNNIMDRFLPVFIISIIPFIICALAFFGIFVDDVSVYYSNIAHGVGKKILPGEPSIDPNMGYISLALTWQAMHQIFTGHFPLWNYYEGFGQPLLGEMQSAALFPPSVFVLLPHGILLEHAFLQWLGALGAYLFFRKFGLSSRAALTGALLWEVNGVFAWLQNTIFNPVAFLPWLLYFVENLFVATRNNISYRNLSGILAGSVLMGAMSVYAGFPEVTYLYGLFVLVWAVYRFVCLSSRREHLAYLGALSIIIFGTLALVAPLLVAFFEFLGSAYIGPHDGANVEKWFLPARAMVQYLFPYIVGGIFGINNNGWWGDIGGYIGLIPFLVALASVFAPGRRTVKMILLGWVIFAIGASHGMPLVHAISIHIPGVRYTVFWRNLNSGWLFCLIFACTLFVDQLPGLSQKQVSRVLASAAGAGCCMALFLLFLARHNIITAWMNPYLPHLRLFSIAMLVMALIGVLGVFVASRLSGQRCQIVLMALLVTEATTWYFMPFLSYPREGKLDRPLITFLQQNAGFGRVVNGEIQGMNGNFGSYFNIPQVNFNDLPTSSRAVNYIRAHLDPSADGTIYDIAYPGVPDAARRAAFRSHLQQYGAAGVKYVLVNNVAMSHDTIDLTKLSDGSPSFTLGAGQAYQMVVPSRLLGSADGSNAADYITMLRLRIDAHHAGGADGVLKVAVCAGTACAHATKDMSLLRRHKEEIILALDHPQRFLVNQSIVVTVEKIGGVHDMAFLLGSPVDNGMMVEENTLGIPGNFVPAVAMNTASSVVLPLSVPYQDNYFTVYEITDARAYFSSDTCKVSFNTREKADVTCPASGKLTRLELFYPGWRATVDGIAVPIEAEDNTFQTISLPAGQHHVVFRYAPTWLVPTLIAAGGACFLLAIGFFMSLRRFMGAGVSLGRLVRQNT